MPSSLAASGTLSLGAVERFGDQPFFPFVDAQRFQFAAAARIAKGQVVGPNRFIIGQHDGAVEHVAKLPHVARPAVSEQLSRAASVRPLAPAGRACGEMVEKEIDQDAQYRRRDRAAAAGAARTR